MKKKNPGKEQDSALPETGIEEIRQLLKKQELQTSILKKIIEKTKESNQHK
jgi:hypothetical protein